MPDSTKICSKCLLEIPLSGFCRRKKSRDGLQHHCKPCHAKRMRESYIANPERKKELSRNWAKNNPEKVKEIERKAVIKYAPKRKKLNQRRHLTGKRVLSMAKLGVSCQDCKCLYSGVAMDFDHIDPNAKSFCVGAKRHYSVKNHLSELLAEIKKCRLLCNNCHRIKTYGGYLNEMA